MNYIDSFYIKLVMANDREDYLNLLRQILFPVASYFKTNTIDCNYENRN